MNRWALWFGSAAMLATMGIAVANIALRPLRMPIQGAFELLGFGGALITALSLGPAQETRSHIGVDILFDRFPHPLKRWLLALSHGGCALFFGLAGWRIAALGNELRRAGELSETLRLPFYPFVWATFLGVWLLVATLLLDMVKAIRGKEF